MRRFLTIPHRTQPGLCPVNGIRDLVHWRSGRDWSNEFLWGLGQGGGFAYLRFKRADPPRQVYWGIAGPRQHRYLAELLGASCVEVENRTFKFSWERAREAVDGGMPPVLGPLDMFYMPFYEDLYRRRHIPIHYELLVGYDDAVAYVQDTGCDEVQEISLEELQMAWDVSVPGLGKRNRLVVFEIPRDLPPTDTLIRRAIADQCQAMLSPPVSMVGIPAMEKVAGEIAHWPKELGDEAAAKCLRQVREYLNSPPDLEGDRLTAGRHLYIKFLEEAGALAGLAVDEAVERLQLSVLCMPRLWEAIGEGRLGDAAALFGQIAEHEGEAYSYLSAAVSWAHPRTPS